MGNLPLILLVGLFALLIAANLGLAITVILRMRGKGETNSPRSPDWNRPFIRGWRYPELRGLMILWTLAMLGLSVVFCVLLVVILR